MCADAGFAGSSLGAIYSFRWVVPVICSVLFRDADLMGVSSTDRPQSVVDDILVLSVR
jgi:hypothetical protein